MIEVEWRPAPGVRALCTSRAGGASVGAWNSCNLGAHVGDEAAAVAGNRRRLRDVAGLPAEPHWLNQVHGIKVVDLDADAMVAASADAAISRQDRICAVLTADCLPVLLAAGDGSAVGAAHAGWRGLAAGVIEATVLALRQQISSGMALHAFLGPAISVAHFEVGDDVRAAFVAHDEGAARAFARGREGRWQCDIYALARQRLAAAGVASIAGGGYCTYEQEDRFFSHRRDVQHRGLDSTGRMASLIWRQK